MITQDGDFYAHGADSYATPAERHLGIPARQRDDEDRAQEARTNANQWRRAYASHAEAHHPEYMRAAIRFVPMTSARGRITGYDR